MSFATRQTRLIASAQPRSVGLSFLTAVCLAQATCLFGSLEFDTVSTAIHRLTGGRAEIVERAYVSLIVTWADGSFDTTSGFRHFGNHAILPAVFFTVVACGLSLRREWGYWLGLLLGWIGVLEPAVRLGAIKQFVPYSDSLGYLLDLQMTWTAMVTVSVPAGFAIAYLLVPSTRALFGKSSIRWRQFTLPTMALAMTVVVVLMNHVISTWSVYGIR